MNQYPSNTRYYDCDISSTPVELWSIDIDFPLSYVMADYDRIFYLDRTFEQSSSYKLKCRDVGTGNLYWEVSVPWLGFYELILHDEKLYVFKNDEENTLICYDAHDGSMLWTSDDIYNIYPKVGVLYAQGMNVSGDKIFVKLGSYHNEITNDVFCCFNADNGNIIWHKNKTQYSNASSYPSVDGGVMYYSISSWASDTGYDSKIIGLDIDTGNVAYEYIPPERYDNLNGRDIVVADGMLYAMTINRYTWKVCILCISTDSNNILWSCDISDSWGDHFIVGKNHVFVNMGTQEGIICIDKRTGQKKWNIPMDHNRTHLPLVTSEYLLVFRDQYMAEIQPQLLLLDIETGAEIWRFTLDGDYLNIGASFYDGKILIGTVRGKLYCFE